MNIGEVLGRGLLLILIIAGLILFVGVFLPILISAFGLNAHTSIQNIQVINNSTSDHPQSENNPPMGIAIIVVALVLTALFCVGVWLWHIMRDIPNDRRQI